MTSVNSFTEKQLRVTFILAGTNQVFPGTNNNTLVLTNLRVSAEVEAVARLATSLRLKVWGMKRADMNALTVVFANPPIVFDHLVIVEANDGNGWAQVFKGTIREAQPEYRAAPDVYFNIVGVNGYIAKIQVDNATPTSYPDSVEADVLLFDLITRMGYAAEIGDVLGTLTNPYFAGTLYDQFAQACAALQADFYFQGDTIVVTPAGRPRSEQPAVVLTPDTGLIGYPVYEWGGLNVDAIYTPAFACATPIELTSSVPSATGRWYPYAMKHVLESRMPGGQWHTQLKCLRVLV
jgi:hypothetical protein